MANSSGNPYESTLWPSVVVILSPFVSIFIVKLYKWKSRDAPKRKGGADPEHRDGIELTDVITTKTKPEETNSPIHILA